MTIRTLHVVIFIAMKLLLLLFALLGTPAVFAQADSTLAIIESEPKRYEVSSYTMKLLDTVIPISRDGHADVSMDLYLSKTGRYIMQAMVWNSSIMCVQGNQYDISWGTFTWHGKMLKLYDESLQTEWIFKAKGKQLVPVKGFAAHQRFIKDEYDYMREDELQHPIAKLDYTGCHSVQHADSGNISGMYQLHTGFSEGLCFHFLFRNSNYEFYYDKQLLFAGTWQWENGKLKLDDKYMQTHFILVRDKDGSLVPERFIGDFCRFYWK